MLIFGIIGFSQKKTWQGSFQIVLEGKESQNSNILDNVNAQKL